MQKGVQSVSSSPIIIVSDFEDSVRETNVGKKRPRNDSEEFDISKRQKTSLKGFSITQNNQVTREKLSEIIQFFRDHSHEARAFYYNKSRFTEDNCPRAFKKIQSKTFTMPVNVAMHRAAQTVEDLIQKIETRKQQNISIKNLSDEIALKLANQIYLPDFIDELISVVLKENDVEFTYDFFIQLFAKDEDRFRSLTDEQRKIFFQALYDYYVVSEGQAEIDIISKYIHYFELYLTIEDDLTNLCSITTVLLNIMETLQFDCSALNEAIEMLRTSKHCSSKQYKDLDNRNDKLADYNEFSAEGYYQKYVNDSNKHLYDELS